MARTSRFLVVSVFVVCAFEAVPLMAQNLLSNPGFDRDLSGWGYGYETLWAPDDASGSHNSGSARLNILPPNSGNNLVQCAEVDGETWYVGGFQSRVVSAQPSAGAIYLYVIFSDKPDCRGAEVGNRLFLIVTPTSDWQLTREEFLSPAGARGVNFLPAAQNYHPEATYSVEFDNTFVQTKASTAVLDGRFKIDVTWETANANGTASGQSLTSESAFFWFFDNQNVELMVKILDGCSVNQHFWVFAAGLTNVGVTLTITDMKGGSTKTYRSPRGTPFQPVQDIEAFAACP